MKINLTDQELNEWVFLNIFKVSFKELEDASEFNKLFHVFAKMQIPDYCQDLNHTHLMEKKIIEMNRWGEFCNALLQLQLNEYNKYKNVTVVWSGDYDKAIHSSARLRCEAAYLTFKEG